MSVDAWLAVVMRHGIGPLLDPQLLAVKNERMHPSTVRDGVRTVHPPRL